MLELIAHIAKYDRGATSVEYGLIVELLLIAMISSLGHLAESNNGIWINVAKKFTKKPG